MNELGVIIGRFQPCHKGHVEGLFSRVQHCEKVIVLLGSSWQALTPKNPWAVVQRIEMIQEACREDKVDISKCKFIPIRDYIYDDSKWQQQVTKIIEAEAGSLVPVLYGVAKDPSTSAYLDMFPDMFTNIISPSRSLSATDIREAIFLKDFASIKDVISPLILASMQGWSKTPTGMRLREEFLYNEKEKTSIITYRHSLEPSKRELIGVTVDNFIVWRNCFLMIERRRNGLLALPGGHVNRDESLLNAAIRELKEETNIKVMSRDKELLLKNLRHGSPQVFDHPQRSLAGRKISHLFMFHIDGNWLCTVEPGDDAVACHWINIHEFKENKDDIWSRCFEDHQFIIEKALG